MENKTHALIDVLKNTENFDLDYALFLSARPWKTDTKALVLDPDDVGDPTDPDADPQEAKDLGMQYALMMQDIDDICENLKSQVSLPSDEDFLKAFNFYMENDAFIQIFDGN
ncbi:DUF7716 domain-containing protein [Halomonas sp. V046]|uniref:DUF7716 domain-containing protein n=1 Tax=Halomonas sp. V046 TaxID=3459611 RepID=UPI004044D460